MSETGSDAAGCGGPVVAPPTPDDIARLAAGLVSLSPDGWETLPTAVVRALLACATRVYAARRRSDAGVRLRDNEAGLTPTEVMIVARDLLHAVNAEAFELDMWRSWGMP